MKLTKKSIYFDDEINEKTISDLIDKIDEHSDKKINLYLTSGGGSVSAGIVFTDYLNQCGYDLTLIASWTLNSGAFDIFFKAVNVDRRIMPNTHSLIHLSRRDVSTIELLKNNSYDSFLKKELEETNSEWLEFFKEVGIKEKHLKQIAKGEDVILRYEELAELLQVAESV